MISIFKAYRQTQHKDAHNNIHRSTAIVKAEKISSKLVSERGASGNIFYSTCKAVLADTACPDSHTDWLEKSAAMASSFMYHRIGPSHNLDGQPTAMASSFMYHRIGPSHNLFSSPIAHLLLNCLLWDHKHK